MKIQLLKTIEIDIDKERKRIYKCFDEEDEKEVKERQLKILEEFEAGHFQKALDLINTLPYNKKDECPEQEYMGMAIIDFYNDVRDYTIVGYDYEKDVLISETQNAINKITK